MRLPVNRLAPPTILALAVLALLSACGGENGGAPRLPPLATSGPAADYPVVVGDPFDVGSTTYTPVDRMNFDAVGYASIGTEGGEAVSGANKTLPLPSYVEVTSLDSGKTILIRIERRGPMRNDRLVELSPGAAAQIGLVGDKSAVRVRRVNPPEPERALLRSGQRAPERMETPKPLLAVLLRKMDPQAPVILSGGAATPPAGAIPPRGPAPKPAAKPPVATITPQPVVPAVQPAARPAGPARAVAGSLVVQVGAFSSRANADATAAKVGGRVEPAGRLFRVRSGPFPTRAEAEAALAKAKAAGYSDARIQRAN